MVRRRLSGFETRNLEGFVRLQQRPTASCRGLSRRPEIFPLRSMQHAAKLARHQHRYDRRGVSPGLSGTPSARPAAVGGGVDDGKLLGLGEGRSRRVMAQQALGRNSIKPEVCRTATAAGLPSKIAPCRRPSTTVPPDHADHGRVGACICWSSQVRSDPTACQFVAGLPRRGPARWRGCA